MRLFFVLFLTVPLILIARENPFVAASEQENTTKKVEVSVEPKVSPAPKPKIHPQRPQVKSADTAKTQSKPKVHPQRNAYKKEVVNYAMFLLSLVLLD